jgi:hemerythrin-like domain-containing protein
MGIKIGARPDHDFNEPLGLLSDCHRRVERFLHALVATAEQAQGGTLTPGQRADLENALRYFAKAGPMHTADEEESLFPRLRACGDPAVAAALAMADRLEADHRDAETRHAAVDRLVHRWLDAGTLDPAEAGELRGHLAALQATYRTHIALEDQELFPASARLLSPEQLAAIGREMAKRRGL